MPYDPENIFAKILRGDIPCDKVYENDHVLAFRDINPQAPVHVLVIPKNAYMDAADFGEKATADESKALWKAVSDITAAEDIQDSGFRIIANMGRDGGMEVPHFHLHILGGRALGRMLAETKE